MKCLPSFLEPSRVRVNLTREPTCGTLNPPSFRFHAWPSHGAVRWRASCRSCVGGFFGVSGKSQGQVGLEEYAAFLSHVEEAGFLDFPPLGKVIVGSDVIRLELRVSLWTRRAVAWIELPGSLAARPELVPGMPPRDEVTKRVRVVVWESFIGTALTEARRIYKANAWPP